jgi:hypothetical protein
LTAYYTAGIGGCFCVLLDLWFLDRLRCRFAFAYFTYVIPISTIGALLYFFVKQQCAVLSAESVFPGMLAVNEIGRIATDRTNQFFVFHKTSDVKFNVNILSHSPAFVKANVVF